MSWAQPLPPGQFPRARRRLEEWCRRRRGENPHVDRDDPDLPPWSSPGGNAVVQIAAVYELPHPGVLSGYDVTVRHASGVGVADSPVAFPLAGRTDEELAAALPAVLEDPRFRAAVDRIRAAVPLFPGPASVLA